MTIDKQAKVMARVCYHRGVGKENSLQAINEAIRRSPFLVEFDVQWHNQDLYLGHPPRVSTTAFVSAMELFSQTNVLPKVDLKLTADSFDAALARLIEYLTNQKHQVLVNIAGNLEANSYMLAEQILLKSTTEQVLLNIDIERYAGKSDKEIMEHLDSLAHPVFSISPNLEDNIAPIVKVAKAQAITNVHFWSSSTKTYSLSELYDRLVECQAEGFETYFDINLHNIAT